MRRFGSYLVAFVAGAVVSALTLRYFVPAKVPGMIPYEAAILEVLPPFINPAKYVESGQSLDAVWQREINNILFFLREEKTSIVGARDVERTEWYEKFDDNRARQRALERDLHIEQLPGTSMIVIWLDSSQVSDARTIANRLVRNHLREAERESLRSRWESMSKTASAIGSLYRQEDDIRLELETMDDASKREQREAELMNLREIRFGLAGELAEQRVRGPDEVCAVRLVRLGIDPME